MRMNYLNKKRILSATQDTLRKLFSLKTSSSSSAYLAGIVPDAAN